jgi:hypothetical protein
MSDDWELELDEEIKKEEIGPIKTKFEDESEEIIKPKIQPIAPKEPKEDLDDYERKWQLKNKERLAALSLEEKAFEGLDEKTKLKKLEEKRKLNDAVEFLEGGYSNPKQEERERALNIMTTEKEFVDLAVNSVAKIKSANKPSKFTLTYLKQNIDILGPTLESEKLDQIIKDLTVLFNKKRKEESDKYGKGKKNKQPTINAGKAVEKLDIMGNIEIEDEYEEDEYDDDY